MMKTKTGAALLCALLLILPGCGKEAAPQPPAVSVYELQKAMVAADDTLPEMLTANSNEQNAEENFRYLSSLDYGKVSGYFLAYSAAGLADELAVIVLRDPADAPEAEASLQKHARGRVDMYRVYEPAQAKRAEGAVVFSQGPYAVLIISDRPEAAREAFRSAVTG